MEGENRFVWILTYGGPEGIAARDPPYYDPAERKSLRPDPVTRIESARTWIMSRFEATRRFDPIRADWVYPWRK